MTKETAKGYVQLILIIIFLVCIYLLNFGLQLLKTDPKINNKNNEVPTVAAVTLNAKLEKLSFSNTAQIMARSYIPIIPEVTGRITYVADNFKAGSCFKANQILFKIDTDDTQAEYNRAAAELQQANASLALVEAESKAAISEWNILNPSQSIPSLVARKPQISQAKAAIKTAQARLKLAKIGLDDTKFSFPFAGCVESSQVEVGQFSAVGLGGGQSLGQVFSYNSLEVIVNLASDKAKFIQQIPHSVEMRVNDTVYPSKIDRISDIVDTQTQFSRVILKPLSTKNLQPNKIVQVTFTTKQTHEIFILQENDIVDDVYVRVIDDINQVSRQKIEIISRTNNQIYAKAFAQNVKIIRGGYSVIGDNATVKIAE
ncbi:MAG: RND family efflux transporter MFP subunit [Alphaproteobacteria bacterium]|jgi:RND family efflux transporter MFP subunit